MSVPRWVTSGEENGLLGEGSVLARLKHVAAWLHALMEVGVKHILSALGEFLLGIAFCGLARVIPNIIEPHLGSLVNLPQETRWIFHFLAGASLVLGIFQVLFVLLDYSRVRTIVATFGIFLSAALWWAFNGVRFHGVSEWALTLFIGNVLALYAGDARERARA